MFFQHFITMAILKKISANTQNLVIHNSHNPQDERRTQSNNPLILILTIPNINLEPYISTNALIMKPGYESDKNHHASNERTLTVTFETNNLPQTTSNNNTSTRHADTQTSIQPGSRP